MLEGTWKGRWPQASGSCNVATSVGRFRLHPPAHRPRLTVLPTPPFARLGEPDCPDRVRSPKLAVGGTQVDVMTPVAVALALLGMIFVHAKGTLSNQGLAERGVAPMQLIEEEFQVG